MTLKWWIRPVRWVGNWHHILMRHEENRLASGIGALEGEYEAESVDMLDLGVLVSAGFISNYPPICDLVCQ